MEVIVLAPIELEAQGQQRRGARRRETAEHVTPQDLDPTTLATLRRQHEHVLEPVVNG